jgi:hypothetical protein
MIRSARNALAAIVLLLAGGAGIDSLNFLDEGQAAAPATSSGATPDLTTALAGHWTFDEKAGRLARDSSGHGNHGRLTNMTRRSPWVNGCPRAQLGGSALAFDGRDDYVKVRDNESLETPDALTIACWIRLDRIKRERRNHTFVGKWGPGRDGTGESFIFWMGESAPYDELCFWASAGPWSTRAGTQISYTTNADLAAATWYHVAVVWVANKPPVFYRDGRLLTSVQKGGPYKKTIPCIQSTRTPIKLGQGDRNPPGGIHRLEGLLDDVRIYSRALTAQEIAALASGIGASNDRSTSAKRGGPTPSHEKTVHYVPWG